MALRFQLLAQHRRRRTRFTIRQLAHHNHHHPQTLPCRKRSRLHHRHRRYFGSGFCCQWSAFYCVSSTWTCGYPFSIFTSSIGCLILALVLRAKFQSNDDNDDNDHKPVDTPMQAMYSARDEGLFCFLCLQFLPPLFATVLNPRVCH
jgi:hypothetical protein